jgi:K+/H+ antiporter YhaU regulatory subunit KhtT
MAEVVLRPAVVDFTDMAQTGDELAVDQIKLGPHSPLVDKTLLELQLPNRFGVHVVAMQREDGQRVYHPKPDMRLAVGDTIILVGRAGAAEAMDKLGVEEQLPPQTDA